MISGKDYLIIAPFIDAYNYVVKGSFRIPANVSKLLFELCDDSVDSKEYKRKVEEYISMLNQH